MKIRVLFLLLATLLAAQSTQEVEITAESHHHLIFENKSVRVFNVEVPPNDATQMHWHRHDYIAVNFSTAEISNTVKDKPPALVKLTAGDVNFSPAPFAHSVRPTGSQPIHNVAVEILEDATLRNSTVKWDDDRSLDILHGGTRQILFVKDNIRASETELQPGAVIPKHHHSTPHLLIAVTDLDLRSDVEGQPPAVSHFKSGDAKWFPGGNTHIVTNVGKNPAKYVTLEFPQS